MPEQSPSRRVMKQFMLAVAGLHVTAILLYYALDIPAATAARQRVFGWTWIVLTTALVIAGLQRLKRARRGR